VKKRLQIGMNMLPIATSTSDKLFSRINIDDFERPWTSKIRVLLRTLQEWIAKKWLEIDWQFANRNCYRLSCVSWALAPISCLICNVLTNSITFIVHVWNWQLHCVPKNVPLCDCPCLRQILTDFQNSFTGTFRGQLAIKLLLNVTPHINCVATLPCEV